ncbi:MAG: 30S ribosomal protein S3 [Bacilli bacterium]
MGQKVNPNGLRIGINRDWSSHWYASKKDFASYIKEDNIIRKYLETNLDKKDAGLSHIDIERIRKDITITIHTSRPAIVLGTDGADLKAYKAFLVKALNKNAESIKIALVEVKNPDLDAVLVAKDIAKQIENRGSSRVVQKKAIQRVIRAGALGCKTMCKGRVNGAEIARYEEYRDGVLSLHTLRQNIDYAYVAAHTTYGVIGVKVWMALPENYQELRDKKPEDTRFGNRRGFGFKKPGFRPNNGTKAAAPAATPTESKDAGTKGE